MVVPRNGHQDSDAGQYSCSDETRALRGLWSPVTVTGMGCDETTFRRVQIEYSNLETQPAIEIGVGLAQRPCIANLPAASTYVLAVKRWRNGPG